MSTISLKCKSCGGVLDIDEDREILCCPFCGSKEIFEESDEVKKTRIQTKAYKEVEHSRQEMQRDIELGKKHADLEMERLKAQNKKDDEKRDLLYLPLIILLLAGIIWFISKIP